MLKLFTRTGFSGLIVLAVFAGLSLTEVRADDKRATVIDSCKNDLKRSDSECNCVADEVENRFSEREYKFFVAAIQDKNIAQIQQELNLSFAEMQDIGRQMEEIPAVCEGK